MNIVGQEYASDPGASNNGLFVLNDAPQMRQTGGEDLQANVPHEIASIDITKTASAGASFVVLNFALFGFWSIPFSLAFVFAMDLLLYAFVRMPRASVPAALGAISVPVLSLCFSFVTTVLASKGLLLIPALGWAVGMPWPRRNGDDAPARSGQVGARQPSA
jgi:hypothetical protein